ncbi:hypothetical protein Tco_0042563, partial [Tanacetum coccineum]
MSAKKRTSKRKVRIPSKLVDSICDLNNKKQQQKKNKEAGQSLEENCDNSSSDEIRAGIKDLGEIRDADDVDNTEIDDENSMGEEQIMDAQENGNDDVTVNEWDKSSEAIQDVLDFEPTLIENGNKFVIFDEELVENGSLKWKLT